MFLPLYMAGLQGMTRRMQHHDVPEWPPWMILSATGVLLMLGGVICQVTQLVVSIRNQLRDETDDPWSGRSLEWSTPSPPPVFNFAILPNVENEEPYWQIKQRAMESQQLGDASHYEPIHMPRNSPIGVITAFFATITGFALIWAIWWLAITGLVAAFATFVVLAWRDDNEHEILAEEVAHIDRQRRATRQAWLDVNGGAVAKEVA